MPHPGSGAYYGPHEMRKGYPIKTKNANAMAYDASVATALWEASEKATEATHGPGPRGAWTHMETGEATKRALMVVNITIT